MKGISNEENRRFEELVGSLQDIDKKAEKHANKKNSNLVLSVLIVIAGLGLSVFAVTINSPIIGVVGFLATVLSLNFTLKDFLKL